MGGEDQPIREPPKEILAFPSGKVRTTKGNFLLDEKAIAATMADWKDWSGGIPHKGVFDYNHDMANPDLPGYLKIAAGWFDLEARETGLWAVGISWTEKAEGMIRAGEMRFWSPWFEYEPKTGRILKILNIAITCMPATKAQAPMVAASLAVPYLVAGGGTALELSAAPPVEDEDQEVRAAQLEGVEQEQITLAGRNLHPAEQVKEALRSVAPLSEPFKPQAPTLATLPATAPRASLANGQGAAVAWTHHMITRARLGREKLTMNYGMLYSLKMLIGICADEMSLCLGLVEYMEESGKRADMPMCSRYCSDASKRISWYSSQMAMLAGQEGADAEPSEEESSKLTASVKGLQRLEETERKGAVKALCVASRKGWSALGAMEQLSAITGQERWDLVLSAIPTLKEEVIGARELRGLQPVLATVKEITGGKGTSVEMQAALLALHSNSQRDASIVATAREICGGAVDSAQVVAELKTLSSTRQELAAQKLKEIIQEGLGKVAGSDGKTTIKIVEAQIPLLQKLGVEGARAWLDASPPLKLGSDLTPAPIPPGLLPQPPAQTASGAGAGKAGVIPGQVALSLPPGTVLPAGVSEQEILDMAGRCHTNPAQILANMQ
jgi:hypothetical protein